MCRATLGNAVTDPDGAFEPFALELYRADGVSRAALLLQDRCGVDVNLLLFAAFIGAVAGKTLTERELQSIDQRVGPWQREVVQPLRALRTRLTSGPPPAPTAVTGTLRDRVKALELDAEMVEINELAIHAGSFDGCAAAGTAAERAAAAITVVVAAAAEREPTAGERDAITTIAEAADALGGHR